MHKVTDRKNVQSVVKSNTNDKKERKVRKEINGICPSPFPCPWWPSLFLFLLSPSPLWPLSEEPTVQVSLTLPPSSLPSPVRVQPQGPLLLSLAFQEGRRSAYRTPLTSESLDSFPLYGLARRKPNRPVVGTP